MKKGNNLRLLIISAIVLGIIGLLMALFKSYPDALYPLYQPVSKAWLSLLATLCSFTGIALWDYLVLIGLSVFLGFLLRGLIKKKGLGKLMCRTVLILSCLVSVMVCNFMLNHYGPTVADQIGLDIKEYNVSQLLQATDYYFDRAQQAAGDLMEANAFRISDEDFDELAIVCGKSYQILSEQYYVFTGSTKPVKKISLLGEYLLYNGIVGIFIPITAESGVPADDYPIALPFNMCHEVAHRLSIADEEDCNFAAFLACISNDDLRLNYSGYYMAFRYCFNALYKADCDMAKQLIEKYRNTENYNLVIEDYNAHSLYYDKYDSALSEISDSLNDAYLKAFSNEEGTLSYGMVCDDLVCYFLEKDTV